MFVRYRRPPEGSSSFWTSSVTFKSVAICSATSSGVPESPSFRNASRSGPKYRRNFVPSRFLRFAMILGLGDVCGLAPIIRQKHRLLDRGRVCALAARLVKTRLRERTGACRSVWEAPPRAQGSMNRYDLSRSTRRDKRSMTAMPPPSRRATSWSCGEGSNSRVSPDSRAAPSPCRLAWPSSRWKPSQVSAG